MGTKINTDYYGLESNWGTTSAWGTSIKTSQYNFVVMAENGTWNIANNDDLDPSIIPWGMPKCSVSSMSFPLFCSEGKGGSNYGGYFKPVFHEDEKKNIPIMINGQNSKGTPYTYGYTTGLNFRQNQALRITGQTRAANSYIYSTCAADNNQNYTFQSRNNAPATYADYSTMKVILNNARFIDFNNRNTDLTISNNGLKYVPVVDLPTTTVPSGTDYKLFYCGGDIYCNSSTTSNSLLMLTVAKKFKAPPNQTKRYYNNDDQQILTTERNITTIGFNNVWQGPLAVSQSKDLPRVEDFEGSQTANYPYDYIGSQYMNCSAKKQIFDDVSYHWEMTIRYSDGSIVNWLKEGSVIPATSSSSKNVQCITYMVIDDSIYENIFESYHAAIMHEFAFLGFPLIENVSYIGESIGDTHVHLPVFDLDHMITTGKYKTGSDSLTLANALWHNIFEDTVPDWDPNYIPPDPTHEEHDKGDLYNMGARRFFWNSLKVHLLSAANYDQFIQKLNSLNMTDPDNETWQLQFKGLNPSDYIVGAYASFVKPPKNTTSTIMLGPVDMEQSEYTYKETDSNAGFFTFGTRTINPEFNDFRDFAPYTMIELYLPLCGTVELDTAYFMGASVKVDYYYDIYTMSCTACIYRIKTGQELLYKTVNGTIGAQIPMLSANMGAYQNQIKSIENALKQNELKVMTSTAALAAGIVAAPMTSGASLIAAGTAALSGAAGLMNSIQKQSELEYQIEHIQPSISVTGAADPQTNICTGQLMPKLIIKRAEMLSTYNQAEYAKTIGHACCINDILGYIEGDTESPRSGLVVCSSVDTSGISQAIGDDVYISPTADEVNMIKQALSSGVIL